MDAGQITMMPAAQTTAAVAGNGSATSAAAVSVNGTSAPVASKDTAFGSLLGQTMAALEDENSQSSNALTALMTETVTTTPSVAVEKTTSEGFEVVNQPNADAELAAAVKDSSLLAQISALQIMVVTQPAQMTQVETVTTVDLSGVGMPVETTMQPALNNLQQSDQAAAEMQVQLAMSTDTPVKAEPADFIATMQQSAKGQENNSPIMVPVNTARQALQNKPAVAPAAENAQQPVLAAMQQSSSGQQPLTVADSAPQALKPGQESQALSAEMAVVAKSTATNTAATTVRFSQASDVMVATSGSMHGEGDVSSQLGRQGEKGEASFGTATKTLESLLETGLGEQHSEPVVQARPLDHQISVSPLGQRVATSELSAVADQLKPGQAEHVASQVTERLAKHDIKTGHDQISLKLSPENLGNLQLNLRMEDQRLKLEIVAENRGVRDALLQQVENLKETLSRQNIQMDSFSVTTGNNGSNSQQSQNWRQMTAEQRQQSTHYAPRQSSGNFENYERPVHYFAHQYKSTIDVRF